MKITKQHLQKIIKEELKKIKEYEDPVTGMPIDYEPYKNAPSKPIQPPYDALEGVTIYPDYEDPHSSEYEAREMWNKFISKGQKPDGKPFKNPEEAQAKFIQMFMAYHPTTQDANGVKAASASVLARAKELGIQYKKFMTGK